MKNSFIEIAAVIMAAPLVFAEANVFLPTTNGENWDSDANWSLGTYPDAAGAEAKIGIPTEVKSGKGWRNVKIDRNTVTAGSVMVECGGWTNRITTGKSGDFIFDGNGNAAAFRVIDTDGFGLAMIDLDEPNVVKLATDVEVNSGSAPGDAEYGTVLLKGVWNGNGKNFKKSGPGTVTLSFTNSFETAFAKLQVEDGTLAILDRIYAESVTKTGICRVRVVVTNVADALIGPSVICKNKVSVDEPELFVEDWHEDVTNYGGFVAVSLADVSSCKVFVPDANGTVRFNGRCWTNRTDAVVATVDLADGLKTYSVFVPGEGAPDPSADVGDQELVNKLLATGLELVTIVTENGEEPTCETVNAPPGCIGVGSTNANKVKGSLTIRDKSSVRYDSGKYKKNVSGMTVKVRGNTSASLAKKGFKIKLQQKADLLCRCDDAVCADTEWALLNLSDERDSGRILDLAFGFELNRILGFAWTPSYRYVNLVVNGDYRGLYVLVETVKRNEASRIDVDEDEGYLFEYDAYWWNEGVAFRTQAPGPSGYAMGFSFKYPDPEDVTGEQIAFISNAVERALLASTAGDYSGLIDVESWSLWLLGHDVMGLRDAGGSNMYFTRYDSSAAEKIQMSTMWDFDASFSTPGAWSSIHTSDHFVFPTLIANSHQEFGIAYRENWKKRRDAIVLGMEDLCSDILTSGLCESLDLSRAYNAERWKTNTMATRDEVGFALQWFYERVEWIDAHIDEMLHDPDPDEVIDETIESSIVCRLDEEYWIRTDIGVIPVELTNVNEAVKITVKGLPPGVKFATRDVVDRKTKAVTVPAYSIYGSPKKSGIYTVTITVSPQNRKSVMHPIVKSQIVVVRGKDEYVVSTMCDAAFGTVNGSKVCKKGKKVSIRANPAKGTVFLGWYEEPLFAEKAEWLPKGYLTASQAFVAPSMDLTLFARFAKLENWAVGTFDGIVYAADSNACGTVTFTVSSKGKVSGKFLMSGQGVVFRASAIDDVREIDGAVFFVAHPIIKVNGEVKTLELIIGAGKSFGLGSAAISLGDDGYAIAVQNGWALKPAAFPSFPSGKSALTLVTTDELKFKFGAKGTVTVTGTVSGTKVSKKAQIIPIAWTDAEYQKLVAQIWVYVPPKRGFDGFCKVYDTVLTVGVDKRGKLIFDNVVLNVLPACLGN